jgi:hypothetical protein
MFKEYKVAVKMETKEVSKPATQAYMNIRRGDGEKLTKVSA